MTSLQARRRPLTSPSLRILLATPATGGRYHRGRRPGVSGSRELIAALVAAIATGIFITACEWAAYHWWFRSAWEAAFATVDHAPRSLAAFALVNVAIGGFAIQLFRWAEHHTENLLQAMTATAIATAFIFWVTPTIAIAAMGLLPAPLLAAAPILGLLAGGGGTVIGALLYRWMTSQTQIIS